MSALAGEHYHIYRYTAPITAANIGQAQRLTERWGPLPEGSSIFWTERERTPPISANYVIADLAAPLADTTGLFVWTTKETGSVYYAVTTVYDGAENRTDFGPGNSLTGAVSEAPADPAPVLVWRAPGKRGAVFTQYLDYEAYNPTFDVPQGTDQQQYAYNYSVALPSASACDGTPQAAYPVYLYLSGWGGRYENPAETPYDWCAIQIYGDDPHQTWYYGHSASYDYRRGGTADSGPIVNYTEERLLRAVHDTLAGYGLDGRTADPERVYVYGASMGGSGALALGLRYPNVFAAAYAGEPMTNYHAADGSGGTTNWVNDVAWKWGTISANLPIHNVGRYAGHLAAYDGVGVWNWQNHQAQLVSRRGDDTALIALDHGTQDTVIAWASQGQPAYGAFYQGRRAFSAAVENADHTWLGFAGAGPMVSYETWSPFHNWEVRRSETVPGLSYASGSGPVPPTGPADYNLNIEWSASWHAFAGAPTDTPGLWSLALRTTDGSDQTVDVTPRRRQQFAVIPGASYRWENRRLADNVLIQTGVAVADASGVVTAPAVQVNGLGERLSFSPVGGSSTPTPTATAQATATATSTRTSTPTVTATPTATAWAPPGGIGISDPSLILTPAQLPLQPVGVPFVDPTFGATLRRVSGTSESGGFETQIYSQLQAFSADNAYLLLAGSNGYLVRRTSDLAPVTGLDTSSWNAPRWHPAQAHTLIHFDSNDDTVVRLQFTNLDTLTTATAFTFPAQYQYIRNNQSFDELSRDGRWLTGMLSRNDGVQMIFALDLQTLTLGAQLPLSELYAGPCQPDPQWGQVEPDWIAASPLGRYLVVQWARDGTDRCSGLETFDLQSGAFVGRVYDGHQHGDLGILPDGETEFFMTFELYHPSGKLALGLRELPGTSTVSPPDYVQVLDWGNGEHISCRGPNGVCLVTAGRLDDNGWNPFEAEIFLQYTDGRVLRLAHHRSSSCGYWVAPRASISRDGRYVVFASDWGEQTGITGCANGDELGHGDPYLIDLLAGPTATPTATQTRTPAASVSPTPTRTATPTATRTPTPTPTATGGSAQTIVLPAAADAMIDANTNVNANLGADTVLEIYQAGSEDVRHFLLRFDLSSIPSGATVNSARLELRAFDADYDNGTQDAVVHLVTRPWIEGTGTDFAEDGRSLGVTWNQAAPGVPWTQPGGDYAAAVLDRVTLPANPDTWFAWDVTGAVRGWLQGGLNAGLLVRPEHGDWLNHKFYSREASGADLHPRLVVVYSTGGAATSTPTPTATATSTSTSTPTPLSGAARPWPDTAAGIHVFNDQITQLRDLSDAQIRFAATHYAGTQKMVRGDADRLRALNPDFLILHYRLGPGLGYRVTQNGCQATGEYLSIIEGNGWVQEWPGEEAVQAGWFFPWNGQARVLNCDWGWYLMELGNASYRSWWIGEVLRQLAANDNDGLFADSLSVPNYLGYDHYAPALPGVDAGFEAAWATRIQDWLVYVKAQLGPRYKLIPNAGSWVTTRDPTGYSAADGVMIEGFAEWDAGTPFDLADWQLQMDRILGLTRLDKILILQSYTDGSVADRTFLLSNYLLVKGAHSYINLDIGLDPEWWPEYEIPIGSYVGGLPASAAALYDAAAGVYRRAYTNGLVLINPGAASRSVALGGTYYLATPVGGGNVPADGNTSGWRVDYAAVTSVTLAPARGAILLDRP